MDTKTWFPPKEDMLTGHRIGIGLGVNVPFETWAAEITPFLNEVAAYIDMDPGNLRFDIPDLLERQRVMTAYLGAMSEPYSVAKKYLKVDMGKAILRHKDLTPSMARMAAESDCEYQILFAQITDRLNSNLVHLLEAIRDRLSYEKAQMKHL